MDTIEYFEEQIKIAKDKGLLTLVSDLEYAIVLIMEHRKKQKDLTIIN